MENEDFQPEQSLQLIESMINKAKNHYSENGHLYLLWGWVVLICSLTHFIAKYWNLFPSPEYVWMGTWVAFIYQIIYLSRKRKKGRVKTYTENILNAIWLVFVACGFILGVALNKSETWQVIYPLILMLYGIPTILSGVVLRFRPLIYGGIFCWILCLVSMFLPLLFNQLMIALGVLAAWIIPGYILAANYKKQTV